MQLSKAGSSRQREEEGGERKQWKRAPSIKQRESQKRLEQAVKARKKAEAENARARR